MPHAGKFRPIQAKSRRQDFRSSLRKELSRAWKEVSVVASMNQAIAGGGLRAIYRSAYAPPESGLKCVDPSPSIFADRCPVISTRDSSLGRVWLAESVVILQANWRELGKSVYLGYTSIGFHAFTLLPASESPRAGYSICCKKADAAMSI